MNNIIEFNLKNTKEKLRGDIMCKILKEIKNKSAYELLNAYNIELTPPIDISTLLERIGISTIAKDFTEIEESFEKLPGSILGATFSLNDELTIFYRKFENLHRKKFTVAHELAHCCLHCPTNETAHIEFRIEPFDTQLSQEEKDKEREANIFAGELLIPEEPLLKYYNKLIIPSLSKLANIFDVSSSVMAARLDYLQKPYFKDIETKEILL